MSSTSLESSFRNKSKEKETMKDEDEKNVEKKEPIHSPNLSLYNIEQPIPAINVKKVITACNNCKNSHLACDEGRPCTRCLARGCSETCRDADHKKRGRKPNIVADNPLNKKLKAMEEELNNSLQFNESIVNNISNNTNNVLLAEESKKEINYSQYIPMGIPLYPTPFEERVSFPPNENINGFIDVKNAKALVEHQSRMLRERQKEGRRMDSTSSLFGQVAPIYRSNAHRKHNEIDRNLKNNLEGRQYQVESYSLVEDKNIWEGFADQLFAPSDDLLADFPLDPSLFNMSSADMMKWLFTGIPVSVPLTKQEIEMGNKAMRKWRDPPWNEQLYQRMLRHFASGGLTPQDLIDQSNLFRNISKSRRELYDSLNVGQRVMMESEFNMILQDLKKHSDENPTPTCIWDVFGIVHHINGSLKELCGYEWEIPSKDPMALVMMFRFPRESYLKVRMLPVLKPGEMKLPMSVTTCLRVWNNNLGMKTKLRMGPEGQEEYLEGTCYADVKWNSMGAPILFTWSFMPSPFSFRSN